MLTRSSWPEILGFRGLSEWDANMDCRSYTRLGFHEDRSIHESNAFPHTDKSQSSLASRAFNIKPFPSI